MFLINAYWTRPSDYFVDSVNGSNSNDGLTPDTAKQTLAGLVAIGAALANKKIGLVRGSTWRETVAIPQNGMFFDAYGSGALPLIMGSTLTGLTWSAYSGNIAGSNLLSNPDFETWSGSPLTPDSWTVVATPSSAVNRVAGNTGTYALEFAVDASNNNDVISQNFAFTANQPLTLSFDHQEPDGGLVGWQLLITIGTDSGKYLQADGSWSVTDPGNQGPTTSATWVNYSHAFTTPNSSGTLKLILKRKQAPSGGTPYRLWLDNVHIDSGGTVIPDDTYQCNLTNQTWLVRILGTVFHLGAAKYALGDGEYFWESNKLYVRDSRGTPPANVEIGTRASAFTGNGKTGFVVQNVRFENFNDRVIFMTNGSNNGLVRLCQFDGSARQVDNGCISWDHSNGWEVSYNTFTNTMNDCIYSFNGKFARVLYNTIGKCDGDAADGIQFDYYSDGTNGNGTNAFCLIEGNTIDQRNALSQKGCIITTQGDGTIIRNNVCLGGTFGIAPNGNNQLVENNFIRYTGSFGGLRIAKAYSKDSNTYRNNLIADAVVGINTDFVVESGETLTGSEKLTNCVFQNNTVVNCSQYGVNFATPMGGSFINNVVDCPAVSGDVFKMVSISSGATWTSNLNNFYPQQTNFMNFNGTTYATLAAWRAARGSDASSITSAPVYTNSGAGDYTQTALSPSYGWGYLGT